MLSVFSPLGFSLAGVVAVEPEDEAPPPRRRDLFDGHDDSQGAGRSLDPYAGGIDPYGGAR